VIPDSLTSGYKKMAKKSTREWLHRHRRDPFVREANAQGYRSRAAFKLLQLDASDRLFRAGQQIVDLGAAPGGWSQVAASRVGKSGRVVAVDLLPVEAIANVTLIQGNFLDLQVRTQIKESLSGPVDLVLSDMAPNLSGVRERDQSMALEIGLQCLQFAAQILKSQGFLVVKVFQGQSLAELQHSMAEEFAPIRVRKPRASRSRSAEVYLLARRK